LLVERVELGLLLGEAVGVACLVARAGRSRRLLDQLPDVVAHDGDAVVELIERQRAVIGHAFTPYSLSRFFFFFFFFLSFFFLPFLSPLPSASARSASSRSLRSL